MLTSEVEPFFCDRHREACAVLEQVRAIFDVITPALEQCGASLDDVVSTRMIAADIRADWEALGEVLLFAAPHECYINICRYE